MLSHDSGRGSDGHEDGEAGCSPLDVHDVAESTQREEELADSETLQESPVEEIAALAESRLRETLNQIETLRAAAQRGRTRLEAEFQVQKRRAVNAEERLRQAEAGRQEILDALEEQRITSAELTTVLRAAEYRLADLEKSVETRQAEIAALRESQSGEAEHARALRAQMEVLAEASREAGAERDRLKAEIHAAENERALLAAELENHKRRLARRQEDVERLTVELKEAREHAGARVGKARVAKSPAATADEGADAARLATLEGALAVTRRREASQTEELRLISARVEELEDALQQERSRRSEVEQSLTQREAELEERARACEMLLHERSELQTQVNALRLESEQAGRDLASAQQLSEHGGEQRSLMEARISELDRALQASQEHEAILQATVGELQEVLQNEQAASALLRTETQNRERLRQTLERELLEARGHWIEMESRLQAQTQQHLLELSKNNERSRLLEAERDNLQEQIVNIAAARDRLERECEQLRRRVEMERQKSEMARLQAKLEEVELRHPEAKPAENDTAPTRATLVAGSPVTSSTRTVGEAVPEDLPIVAIGASTGGPAVLSDLLPKFPEDVRACFLIIQHMPPGYTAELASCLAQQARLRVAEARHGAPLLPGTAYVAPGGYHMEIQGDRIRLTSTAPVNKHRPSVDVLFGSLVPVARRVCAVLLSGMGNDGVAGMVRLHAAGAVTVVQDEASSVVWGMPGAAVKAGCADRQLAPAELASFLLARTACCEEYAQAGVGLPA